MKKTNKIVIVLVLIAIIVTGVVITVVKGLNFDLMYSEAQRVDLYIEKNIDNINDIRNIAKEALGNQNIMIQNIEIYNNAVAITAKQITDEQKQNLINKINEKYGSDLKAEEIQTTQIQKVRGREIIKPYIKPFAIASAIVAVYLIIRYFKLGVLKVILQTVGIMAVTQAELLSIMAIARIPIGRFTIPLVIAIYVLTLFGITNYFENKLQEVKKQAEDEE